MVYQQAATLKDYSDAKARLKGLVQNRISRNQPSPVDIGPVGNDKYENDHDHDKQIYYAENGKGKEKELATIANSKDALPENARRARERATRALATRAGRRATPRRSALGK